jgi:general secretion pathway protein G
VVFSTSGTAPANIPGGFYDFNGNNNLDPPYVLDGRQCLVFFLGGIPVNGAAAAGPGQTGVTGFSKNPANPFLNSVNPTMIAIGGNNRSSPFFEFQNSRFQPIPVAYPLPANTTLLFPAYFDPNSSLSNPAYYAYFSAYGGAYDPNDVNVAETDDNSNPIQILYNLQFPVYASGGTAAVTKTGSPAPNPYTSSLTQPPTGAVTYLSPQSFQIISPGSDAMYGGGGQYTPNASTLLPPNGASDRNSEIDNLTNFHNGRISQ